MMCFTIFVVFVLQCYRTLNPRKFRQTVMNSSMLLHSPSLTLALLGNAANAPPRYADPVPHYTSALPPAYSESAPDSTVQETSIDTALIREAEAPRRHPSGTWAVVVDEVTHPVNVLNVRDRMLLAALREYALE